MKNESFIMLPNKIVWDGKDMKDTYLYSYGEKILHIFSYLDGMTNRFGKTIFTLENMIISCGLVPKSGKGKVNNQFKKILIDLQLKNIIETTVDLNTIQVNSYINCIFNMPIDKSTKKGHEGENTRFFNITHDSYLEIMDRYTGELIKLTLLKVYYYISARLSRRETVVIEGKIMSNDIQVHGDKAETFYDSYDAITKDLGCAEDTWCTYIKELHSLGLLFYDNIGLVKKGTSSHTANNVYCIEECELSEALKQSKLFYITDGYTILGKKTDKESRVIGGLKGKIQQEQNINKDTSKLESKLEKLEKSKTKKNNPNEMFQIKNLLEENEGEILSSIFDGINDKTAERWFKLEVSLGVVDDDSNYLLVEYEYYKWVVMNYEKSKHDYFVNCVSKHKEEEYIAPTPKGKGEFGGSENKIPQIKVIEPTPITAPVDNVINIAIKHTKTNIPSEYLGIKPENSLKYNIENNKSMHLGLGGADRTIIKKEAESDNFTEKNCYYDEEPKEPSTDFLYEGDEDFEEECPDNEDWNIYDYNDYENQVNENLGN